MATKIYINFHKVKYLLKNGKKSSISYVDLATCSDSICMALHQPYSCPHLCLFMTVWLTKGVEVSTVASITTNFLHPFKIKISLHHSRQRLLNISIYVGDNTEVIIEYASRMCIIWLSGILIGIKL